MNKIIKKLFSVLLSSMLVFSMLVTVYAEGSGGISNRIYSTITEVDAGSQITVPILVDNNQGFAGFDIKLTFDSSILTPVRVDASDDIILGGMLNDTIGYSSDENVIDIIWSGSNNITENGVLFSVVFEVNPDAQGETAIQMSYVQRNTFNEDIDDVVLSCTDINLNIISKFDGLPNITLTADNIVAGETVTLIGTLSNQTSFSSHTIDIAYDDANFTYISVNAYSNSALNVISASNGHIVFKISGVSTSLNGSQLFAITLKSKNNAISGNYTFSGTSKSAHILSANVIVNASATSEVVKVSAKGAVKANNGETFVMPITFENNKGLMGFKLRITYDNTLLTPVSVSSSASLGGNLNDNIGNSNGYFDILWNNSENVYVNGELLYVTFRVKTSDVVNTNIKVTYSQADTFTENFEDVSFKCSGSVAVLNSLIGDVDFNGVVNSFDYAEIVSYVLCQRTMTPAEKVVSDLNSDGVVDGFDAIYLDLIINNVIK